MHLFKKTMSNWQNMVKPLPDFASFCHWAALDLSNAVGDGSLLMPRGWSQHRCFMCPSSFSGFLFCNLPSDLPMSTASSSASFWNMGSSISKKLSDMGQHGSTTPTGWVFLTSQWPRTLPTNTYKHLLAWYPERRVWFYWVCTIKRKPRAPLGSGTRPNRMKCSRWESWSGVTI